ncbi:MAG: MGMT family protein [Fervidicoccaceae archaeon]
MEILSIFLQIIPPGKVTTYASLARLLGTSPRAVGKLLSKNRSPIIVPCHRVVKSSGDIGGYSLGANMKKKLLALEGVKINGNKISKDSIFLLDEFLH